MIGLWFTSLSLAGQAAVVLGALAVLYLLLAPKDPLPHIPGPPTKPVVGTPVDGSDVAMSLLQYSRQYGPTFKVNLGGWHVVVTEPDDLRKVFVTKWESLDRGRKMYGPDGAQSTFGPRSLEVVENAEWKPLRHTMNRIFTQDWQSRSARLMNEKTDALLEHIQAKTGAAGFVDVVPIMQNVSLDVLTLFMLSKDYHSLENEGSDIMDAVQLMMEVSMGRNVSPVPYWHWVKTAAEKKFDAASELLYRITDDVLAERQANGYQVADADRDLLSYMDEAVQNGEMTLAQLRDNARTQLFAADTTPAGLSWMCWYLGAYPEMQDRLRAEVRAALGGARHVTPEHLKDMPYLTMFFKEVLRIKPPVRAFQSRVVKESVELGGYVVPAGTHVALCTLATHYNSKYWADPEVFDPERFSAEGAKGRPVMAYIPFLQGKRNCYGMRFADLEVKLIMARIVAEFRISLEKPEEPAGIVSFVYHPTEVRMRLDRVE